MTTSPLTIVAEFRIPAGNRAHFLELCAYDSAHSVADEKGCQRFEAISPLDDPQTVILVEVYDDEEAFEAHLATPHFKVFETGVKELDAELVSLRKAARMAPVA
ncbi:antibiotic biosynthesis monooxygenase [Komagataeibacter rhaeticus]|uniref:Antibiotic biosynthesis monooxygenase n=1 Tax=Komagataeibacter rhaeticus TaxID=215221 RepID=A0A181C7U6_9PROT|nr:antibiotic biosynthesis monooxygenase family protein [Komagataeibacter rhaeticus]ATU73600.1 antibiotic biosynthesis monooxygenase [Komagataeibacter xylinus]KDU95277.1 antibiotic biosynthesis monooxygenase [Komagataeibacter rhaeticus AF1]MBL7240951.1 antibiotic biosynthesis monooxygenase [Komagataeibacter rhaeticus]MDT8870936.1 antibiotic biosynthesis monooxygenase family protein [Komagataeibacter rhaeticus]PYD53961.1 antibiotic biosynthesis monooxygenase [Komagataeibacter rhaeticus]